MLNINYPLRVTRSVNTTPFVIVFNQGGSGANFVVGAFTFENVNFTTIRIRGNNTDTWGTPSYDSSHSTLDQIDGDDGRRKNIIIPSVTFNYQYIRLDPSGLDSGATFYQIGSFGVWRNTLTTLTKNFGVPLQKTIEDQAEEIEFVSGGREIGVAAPATIRLNLVARLDRSSAQQMSEYQALANVPRNRVILLYENNGDGTKIYHCRRASSFVINKQNDTLLEVSGMQFLEVI